MVRNLFEANREPQRRHQRPDAPTSRPGPVFNPEQLRDALQAFVDRVSQPQLRAVLQEALDGALAGTHQSAAGTFVLDDGFLPVIDLKFWLDRSPEAVAIELAEAKIFATLAAESAALHSQGADRKKQWVSPHRQLYERYGALRQQYGVPPEHDLQGERIVDFLKKEGWLDT